MKININAICDRGTVRDNNEDMISIGGVMLRDYRIPLPLSFGDDGTFYLLVAAGYVRTYTAEDLNKSIKRTSDYLDSKISMEEWCKRYGIMLKFDPVERTQKWEDCIYDVEAECYMILKDENKGMGFLAKHGIDWKSPSIMNPRVMFD